MRIGWPGHARLSLVRQSPLLRGRFSFQDEVDRARTIVPRTGQLRFLCVGALTRSAYSPSVVTIRRATVQNAPALDRLNVRLLQAAYGGQMPDEQLNGQRPEEQAAAWKRGLRRDRARDPVLVVQQDDRVVGFAVVGPAHDPEGAGELCAINVDPDHWGTGVGSALLAAAQAELARLGYAEAVLWVLPDNARARRFYELTGWTTEGTQRTSEVLGVVVPKVRYRRRLQDLLTKA
jgi:ribosomal protein S18 acetylase RimI-like enzyme